MNHPQHPLSLDEQRRVFSQRSFMAMPLAGAIVWLGIGLAGIFLPIPFMIWVIFIGTGCIVYLGMFISIFTGENFMAKDRPKNTFDQLFFFTVGQALLVYSIAIPFFSVVPDSLPMTVGILTGLMWLPFSWIIQHWVGLFHAISRTVLVVFLWYLLPEARFVAIPFVIVLIYACTLIILKNRKKASKF